MSRLMNIEEIVESLKQERNRIDAAIAALDETGSRGGWNSSRGRRAVRHMSAKARARISAAQKKRWALRKAAEKKK